MKFSTTIIDKLKYASSVCILTGAGVSQESGVPTFRSTLGSGLWDKFRSQNVDGLHQAAGSINVLELHGNIHFSFCIDCNKTASDQMDETLLGKSAEILPALLEAAGFER